MQSSELENRITGCLVGMAVGDALGAQVEFWPRERVRSRFPDGLKEMRDSNCWEAGQYTDDTEMALLLADSLLEHKRVEPIDLANRFYEWSKTANDVGNQTRRVLGARGYLENPLRIAQDDFADNPDNSAGNGAVMRCAPVALFRMNDTEALIRDSRVSAAVTHADPKALSSCVLVNMGILHLLEGGDKRDCWSLGLEKLSPEEKGPWNRLPKLSKLGDIAISSSGYTVSTVEAAFWSLVHSDSFEHAIELAAGLGDDADTVAAVTGALAGAHYGYDSIPQRWLNPLFDAEMICQTAIALAHRHDVERMS